MDANRRPRMSRRLNRGVSIDLEQTTREQPLDGDCAGVETSGKTETPPQPNALDGRMYERSPYGRILEFPALYAKNSLPERAAELDRETGGEDECLPFERPLTFPSLYTQDALPGRPEDSPAEFDRETGRENEWLPYEHLPEPSSIYAKGPLPVYPTERNHDAGKIQEHPPFEHPQVYPSEYDEDSCPERPDEIHQNTDGAYGRLPYGHPWAFPSEYSRGSLPEQPDITRQNTGKACPPECPSEYAKNSLPERSAECLAEHTAELDRNIGRDHERSLAECLSELLQQYQKGLIAEHPAALYREDNGANEYTSYKRPWELPSEYNQGSLAASLPEFFNQAGTPDDPTDGRPPKFPPECASGSLQGHPPGFFRNTGTADERPPESLPPESPSECQKASAPNRPQEPSVFRELGSLALKIVMIAGIAALIFTFVYGFHYNVEPGMDPSVKDGDLVLYYRWDKNYKTRDILLLTFRGQNQIRRVIATAGDTVNITEEGLVINGALQQEPDIYQKTERYTQGIDFPLTLGENEVFVLADAREGATDGRIYGPVNIEDTKGTVIAILRRRSL